MTDELRRADMIEAMAEATLKVAFDITGDKRASSWKLLGDKERAEIERIAMANLDALCALLRERGAKCISDELTNEQRAAWIKAGRENGTWEGQIKAMHSAAKCLLSGGGGT